VNDAAIETLQLTRSYGEVRAVDDLGLEVPRGAVYAFLGPNGAGKTTTIRMLLGLIRPDRGEVRLFGQTLGPETRRRILRRIGALVETPSLYPHLTGRENLETTRLLVGWPEAAADDALRIVGLERDAHRLVKGYSLGMRQRLGLALALLGNPDLLVLDEPTNGLDPAGIHEVRELIRRLAAEVGITIFLSSHLLGEVEQVATHVGIIGQGRLLFQGTPPELQGQRHDRVVVEVDQPVRALLLLRGNGWTVEAREEQRLIVQSEGPSDTARIAAALVNAGLALTRLSTERPTLEELFLDLTRSRGLDPVEVTA
jgi:lantibiotic transport system ATP-binding protein